MSESSSYKRDVEDDFDLVLEEFFKMAVDVGSDLAAMDIADKTLHDPSALAARLDTHEISGEPDKREEDDELSDVLAAFSGMTHTIGKSSPPSQRNNSQQQQQRSSLDIPSRLTASFKIDRKQHSIEFVYVKYAITLAFQLGDITEYEKTTLAAWVEEQMQEANVWWSSFLLAEQQVFQGPIALLGLEFGAARGEQLFKILRERDADIRKQIEESVVIRKEQKKAHYLLLLRHASTCPHDNTVSQCPWRLCEAAKGVWTHVIMTGCQDRECTEPHCLPTRTLLCHYSC
jgi:hypothetical protein